MDYSTFIGNRYIRSKKKRTISAIAFIAIMGVALGVGALSAVLCISTGFEDEFTKKVLGVNAHILVMKYGMNFSEYGEVMDDLEGVKGVKATEPFVIQEMMISRKNNSAGVLLKGIDPNLVKDVLDLPGHIVEGTIKGLRVPGSRPPEPPQISRNGRTGLLPAKEKTEPESEPVSKSDDRKVEKNSPQPSKDGSKKGQPDKKDADSKPLPGIVIGRTLAENLQADVGDTVQITTPLIGLDILGWSPSENAPKYRKFRITGIFYAGFLEYDTKLVFVDYYQAQRFFNQGDSVTGIELVVDDMHEAKKVSSLIEKELGAGPYRTVDWEELNKPLFTALKTQKLAFTVLLSIIVGIAAFNIIATLVMMVFDKRREIAILKSMGASHIGVMRIFLHAGTAVGTVGIMIGLSAGYTVCLLLDRIGWPLDAEVYLIDHLPVTIDWMNFAVSALVAFLICVVATVIPSMTASSLRPVDGMRSD